jgi:hypothetical protein
MNTKETDREIAPGDRQILQVKMVKEIMEHLFMSCVSAPELEPCFESPPPSPK